MSHKCLALISLKFATLISHRCSPQTHGVHIRVISILLSSFHFITRKPWLWTRTSNNTSLIWSHLVTSGVAGLVSDPLNTPLYFQGTVCGSQNRTNSTQNPGWDRIAGTGLTNHTSFRTRYQRVLTSSLLLTSLLFWKVNVAFLYNKGDIGFQNSVRAQLGWFLSSTV